jgi:hypothetical protein
MLRYHESYPPKERQLRKRRITQTALYPILEVTDPSAAHLSSNVPRE